jgi:TRAP-type transport system small permease protein
VTIAGTRRSLLYVFETLAIIAFVVMLSSSLLQVFFRYAINSPLMWTEELARLMCVITTYFGSVVVLISREHIRVDMIDRLVTGRAAFTLDILIDVLMAWFLVAFAIGCWMMTRASWTTYTASMPWFRMGYIYIAVGTAAAGMTLILVLDILSKSLALAGRRNGAGA